MGSAADGAAEPRGAASPVGTPACGGGGAAGASSGDGQQRSLQAVLLVQQLVLFAPQALRARRHVPLLRANLLSPRPALRRAAAATLRQLANRDPGVAPHHCCVWCMWGWACACCD